MKAMKTCVEGDRLGKVVGNETCLEKLWNN
jgi:hypothetical protein